MRYLPKSPSERSEMLADIGLKSVDELFTSIPEKFRLAKPLDLPGPLSEAEIFPPRTIHLLRLGEETAQLGQMSLRAAEIHEEQARLIVQRLVSLLVPVITIVMGAAVATIIGSLLLAMLSLNDLAG